MAANLQGIVINEILADPTGGTQEVDVNGDGQVSAADEFVELYNSSNLPVDISGWTLDDGDGANHTVPANTILQPGEYYLAETGFSSSLNDTGDEVILTDTQGNSIAAIYNGGQDPNDLIGITEVDDFGSDQDGLSIQRLPDGGDNFSVAAATPGAINECFLTGTLLLTQQDEVAVETLEIGDLVQTAQGDLVTIKWIGHQTVNPKAPHHPFRSLPIQIKAGALGDNLPTRDLFVSPDHALLVDGLLINAGALENGVSILATQPEETFTYYHIELENHSLLIAEGTYAESYLPQNQGRETFDNGDEYETLYPNHNILSLLPMSFPRVSSKRQLPRCVAKRLLEVAETLPEVEVGAMVA